MSDSLKFSRLIFWQNFPNHLQSAFLRPLAEDNSFEVFLVTQTDISGQRRDMGWAMPDFGRVKVMMKPDEQDVASLLECRDNNTVHVFSGVDRLVNRAFHSLTDSQAILGIMSEPFVWLGMKGILRLLRGRLENFRFGRRIDFVLAIGHMAEHWFRLSGYPSEKIYPWGYFVEAPHNCKEIGQLADRNKRKGHFAIIFIGQCVKRKGLDLLLRSLKYLKELDWELRIIGDGPERMNLENLASSIGIEQRVVFSGSFSHVKAMRELACSDLLVLPSLWDGWGAVVNEGMMRGVPVVCSDRCGAADLIWGSGIGSVFSTGSQASLVQCLREQILQGKTSAERSLSLRKWSHNISGQMAADYFLKVIIASRAQKPKPEAPWKEPLSGFYAIKSNQ